MVDEKYNRIIEYLNGINQYTNGTGVERGRRLLKQMGNPEAALKIVHVAGTNGKGSVCSYIASVFKECGYKTGLFTSPHLIDIRERIQINGRMIEKEQFVKSFNRVLKAEQEIKESEPDFKLAYFDYFFAAALDIFAEENVDFVVMETGLGGRLDITNAVERPVVSVITTISLEHTAILGNTIEEIATEKAGIIKERTPVVYCNDKKMVSNIIENTAKACNTRAIPVSPEDYEITINTGKYIDFSLHNEYYKCDCFSIATGALYQVMNASVALMAVAVTASQSNVCLNEAGVYRGIKNMYWPGRMEEVLPDVYVDGAHNPQGISAFVKSVNEICQKREAATPILLFSVVNDKDYEGMIKTIEGCRYFKSVIVTQTGGKRQLSKDAIALSFSDDTNVTVYEIESVVEAFEFGLRKKSDLMFCAGSLYLAGEIKEYLKSNNMEAKS